MVSKVEILFVHWRRLLSQLSSSSGLFEIVIAYQDDEKLNNTKSQRHRWHGAVGSLCWLCVVDCAFSLQVLQMVCLVARIPLRQVSAVRRRQLCSLEPHESKAYARSSQTRASVQARRRVLGTTCLQVGHSACANSGRLQFWARVFDPTHVRASCHGLSWVVGIFATQFARLVAALLQLLSCWWIIDPVKLGVWSCQSIF